MGVVNARYSGHMHKSLTFSESETREEITALMTMASSSKTHCCVPLCTSTRYIIPMLAQFICTPMYLLSFDVTSLSAFTEKTHSLCLQINIERSPKFSVGNLLFGSVTMGNLSDGNVQPKNYV